MPIAESLIAIVDRLINALFALSTSASHRS